MAQGNTTPLTIEILKDAEARFRQAQTVDEVKETFRQFYQAVGYKRLCRMFVLGHGAEELWLAEADRSAKQRERG